MGQHDPSLLRDAAERGIRYLETIPNRSVAPPPGALTCLPQLAFELPDGPTPPERVIELLDTIGSPATVGTMGGRYFGFVIGSATPAVTAANWLAGAWNQNAGLRVMSPVGAVVEEAALQWTIDLLNLPH